MLTKEEVAALRRVERNLIAGLKAAIKREGPLTSEELTYLLEGRSPEEADWLMKQLGYVGTPMSLGELYHDAVRRNDDPDEIAWLKDQWMKEGGTAQ
jgi:hypothetical protein